MFWMLLTFVAASTLILSVVAFLTYGFDKWSARRGRGRVAEKTLHTMAVLGGWPGAYAGQRVFRHKTQKAAFQRIFWCSVAIHVIVVCLSVYAAQRLAQGRSTRGETRVGIQDQACSAKRQS